MKKPRAQDPRPARTRTAILEAIETLERDGGELTVSSIVRTAGISRSSFYTHYKDLDALVVDLIRDIYEKIEELDAELRPVAPGEDVTRETVGLLLGEIAARKHLYAAVLGSGMSAVAQRQLLDILAKGAAATLEQAAPTDVNAELASRYLAGGTLGTIIWWVTASPDTPMDDVREQLLELYPVWVTSEPVATAPHPGGKSTQ